MSGRFRDDPTRLLRNRVDAGVWRRAYQIAGENANMLTKEQKEIERRLRIAELVAHRPKHLLGETKDIDEKEGIVVSMISTGELDRDSEVVIPGAFSESIPEFMKNPVVFFGHQHSEPPIGKALEMEDTKNGLRAVTQFARKESDFAALVFRLNVGGYLRAWSAGFIPLEYSEEPVTLGQKGITHTKAELFEYSNVGVPSNRGALTEFIKGIAGGMVSGLFSANTDPSDPAPIDPVVKEGRVLSAKNRDAIEAAIIALQELVSQDDVSREGKNVLREFATRKQMRDEDLDEIITNLTTFAGGIARRRAEI